MNPEDAAIMGRCRSRGLLRDVPWTIWAVVALLGAEGAFGNLPAIPRNPTAAYWLAAKCLFIVGLNRHPGRARHVIFG